MRLRDRLERWYRTWLADAGNQDRVIPSQAERWRAIGGEPKAPVGKV
jgi:hypothetical protein